MPQLLPLIPSVPSYRVATTLAGTQYVLDVRWNGRAAAWYMDLLQEDTTPIALGIKIVLGRFIGIRVTDPAFPPGIIMASDLSGAGIDATLDDIGTRVAVYFYTLEEINA